MGKRIENRRGGDRRLHTDPNYSGPERRVALRRQPTREPLNKLGLLIGAIGVFFVADATLWHGEYRHAAFLSFLAKTDAMREWGAHIWDMG